MTKFAIEGIRVGDAVKDRPDFVWMGWDEWLREYRQLAGRALEPK